MEIREPTIGGCCATTVAGVGLTSDEAPSLSDVRRSRSQSPRESASTLAASETDADVFSSSLRARD